MKFTDVYFGLFGENNMDFMSSSINQSTPWAEKGTQRNKSERERATERETSQAETKEREKT